MNSDNKLLPFAAGRFSEKCVLGRIHICGDCMPFGGRAASTFSSLLKIQPEYFEILIKFIRLTCLRLFVAQILLATVPRNFWHFK
jgi:hypothetical protein